MFVSFGLGLSATIHFLNRMTQRRRGDEDPAIAVEQATVLMGPALILTTLVLACGLAALVFSDLPPLRLFGWLGALAMLAALVADLLILRPVVTFLLRLGRRWPPTLKEATVSMIATSARRTTMSATLFSLRLLSFNTFSALALAMSLAGLQSAAAAAGPFERFLGSWSGAGQIIGTNGHRESIRCKAEYTEAKGGAALNQAIVCASESFKLNIHSYAEASGESVQGYWKEASRDVSGQLTGRISAGRFEGEFTAPAFTATISLTSNGRTQAVSIQPRGGDISDVRVELRRRG